MLPSILHLQRQTWVSEKLVKVRIHVPAVGTASDTTESVLAAVANVYCCSSVWTRSSCGWSTHARSCVFQLFNIVYSLLTTAVRSTVL